MKISAFDRFALSVSIGVSAVMLAACSESRSAFSPATATQVASNIPDAKGSARKYAALFSFDQTDGGWPDAELLNVDGTLYGTTLTGGVGGIGVCGSSAGCGMVFSVTPSGSENVLYEFKGTPDSAEPMGQLVRVNGTLYGTTYLGGDGKTCHSTGCGTVFSVTPEGKERVLHSFAGGADGSGPEGGLVNVNGTLYGTTSFGGTGKCYGGGCGTVFSITTAGKERVIYNFGNPPDGNEPVGPLLDVRGTLYGTTFQGGGGSGTVFSVTTAGAERVLHRFAGARDNDGADPAAGLIAVKGMLYGTTEGGGALAGYGHGTVFSVTTAGQEHVLYSFAGSPDGAVPRGSLIYFNRKLYGTTYNGGKYGGSQGGFGTVFSVTTAGTERILHTFSGPPDGDWPIVGLAAVNGALYGTTYGGGEGVNGWGTVFMLKP